MSTRITGSFQFAQNVQWLKTPVVSCIEKEKWASASSAAVQSRLYGAPSTGGGAQFSACTEKSSHAAFTNQEPYVSANTRKRKREFHLKPLTEEEKMKLMKFAASMPTEKDIKEKEGGSKKYWMDEDGLGFGREDQVESWQSFPDLRSLSLNSPQTVLDCSSESCPANPNSQQANLSKEQMLAHQDNSSPFDIGSRYSGYQGYESKILPTNNRYRREASLLLDQTKAPIIYFPPNDCNVSLSSLVAKEIYENRILEPLTVKVDDFSKCVLTKQAKRYATELGPNKGVKSINEPSKAERYPNAQLVRNFTAKMESFSTAANETLYLFKDEDKNTMSEGADDEVGHKLGEYIRTGRHESGLASPNISGSVDGDKPSARFSQSFMDITSASIPCIVPNGKLGCYKEKNAKDVQGTAYASDSDSEINGEVSMWELNKRREQNVSEVNSWQLDHVKMAPRRNSNRSARECSTKNGSSDKKHLSLESEGNKINNDQNYGSGCASQNLEKSSMFFCEHEDASHLCSSSSIDDLLSVMLPQFEPTNKLVELSTFGKVDQMEMEKMSSLSWSSDSCCGGMDDVSNEITYSKHHWNFIQEEKAY